MLSDGDKLGASLGECSPSNVGKILGTALGMPLGVTLGNTDGATDGRELG